MMGITTIKSDLTVIGGGLAGICAAIAAARENIKVALVTNRPVLGGNSSSEMRMWTRGATGGENLFAEEMGILGELKLENLYRNPEGNVILWDETLLDLVLRENNLTLFLNTHVHEAQMAGEKRLAQVKGYQMGSEREFWFTSHLFLDATGDGTVGYLAGAEYRRGREGKAEFQEMFAPDQPDLSTLGSTIYFQTREAKKPVRFVAPSFAYSISEIKKLLNRGGRIVNEKMSGCDYWWLEYGGVLDTITDNEAISLELRRVALGVWNYIKNSGEFPAEKLTLEWLGPLPAKRESRRFVGDYLLTQNEIMQNRNFDDAVCYGGWYLDFHPPDGIYSAENFCEQIPVNLYSIPMRCLYSKNISNLLFAGRNISVTHAAFASTRIMNTCALTGQAAGTIARYAVITGKTFTRLYEENREEIRQRLLMNDMYIIGCPNNDLSDQAKTAAVAVSSVRKPENTGSSIKYFLTDDLNLVFPLCAGENRILIKMDILEETGIDLELYRCIMAGFHQGEKIDTQRFELAKARDLWVEIPLSVPETGTYRLVIKQNDQIAIHGSKQSCTGILAGWAGRKTRFDPCFILPNFDNLYGKENLNNGWNRPYLLPNLWISGEIQNSNEWVSLTWEKKISVREIRLFFNPDLSKELNNLHGENWAEHHGFIPRLSMPPELVREYQIYARINGAFQKLVEVKENRKRLAVHLFEGVKTDQIKIELVSTYGSPYVEVFEVRVY